MARNKDSPWEKFRKTWNNDKRYNSSVEGTLAKINGKHKRNKKNPLEMKDPFKM